GLHAKVELARELVVPAVEKEPYRANLVLVPGLVDVVDAWRETATDLVLKARPLAAGELLVRTSAKLEVLVDKVQRSASGGRRMVRSEVAGAVRRRPAHGLDARPRVRDVDAKAKVALVVAKLDVVTRVVLLDEAVLEDGRFLFRSRDDGLEVADGPLQKGDERAIVSRGLLEVAPHPGSQALGLADVDDLSLLVPEEVATGLRRKRLEFL